MTSTREALLPTLLLLAGAVACGNDDTTSASASESTPTTVPDPTTGATPPTTTAPGTSDVSATDTPTEGTGTASGSTGTGETGEASTGGGSTEVDPTAPKLDVGIETDTSDTGAVVTCDDAADKPSNFGCEFWAVDMDQQDGFNDPASAPWGVAISPAGFGVTSVTIEINLAPPGEPLDLMVVEQLDIGQDEVVPVELPTRELDCGVKPNDYASPGTCLSSNAFRITSSAPIVVYQFNVFKNAFSNDASLLLPTPALDQADLQRLTVLLFSPETTRQTIEVLEKAGLVERITTPFRSKIVHSFGVAETLFKDYLDEIAGGLNKELR